MKKERRTLIFGIILLVLIIIGIIVLTNTSMFKEYFIKRDMKTITKQFYSYYYDDNNQDNGIKNFLKKFEKTGLTISLKDMQIYINSKTGKETNYKTLEKCDIENTKVIMYPKDPYTKNDIDLKFELSCK